MNDFIVRKIWRKIGKKYNHKYYDKNNKEIKDKKKIGNAIKGVYIAPAYDNVKINLKKDEKVLAIGYDDAKDVHNMFIIKNILRHKVIKSLIK